MDKTTQQIIDEDFEGGLTMGQLQCKDCNDNLTDCTCIEDTVDMKQETLNEVALEFAKDHHEMYETNNFGAMHFGFCWGAKYQKEQMYSEEEVKHLMTLSFEQGFKKADIVEAGLEAKETDTEVNWIFLKHKKDYDSIHGKNN